MNCGPSQNDTTCQLLCLKLCSGEPGRIEPSELPNLKLSKLSLKRFLQQNGQSTGAHKLQSSASNKNLKQVRSQTTRSQNEVKEIALFRKKALLEQQIEKVDGQMGRLTLKYQRSINQLRAIKKELQVVRNM